MGMKVMAAHERPMCAPWLLTRGMRGCPGKLYTNLDATEVMRTSEHADGCQVDPHTFYHHQQLGELRRLASEDPRPALNAMNYSRALRYPRLPARRQDLRLTAEQTTTKSGAQLLMKDLPTYSRIFEVLHSKVEELGVQFDPVKFVCDFETAVIPGIQGNFPNTRVQGCFFHFCQTVLWQYFQREWLPATKIPLWNVHGVAVRTNNHLEGWHSRVNRRARKHHLGFHQFLRLIIDEQAKTETVVRKMTDGYTRGRAMAP
ncbi:hypothetical protein T11_8828 [Trichinella zimbabwensis]|uniref:MULE transposase domain-containing protein n=1 Tax=Trichinella zimbabwensis TaxID=268475 RepID=A0A0V1HYE5_9BILA|nr:hypothetical protein T11_8828 [Trichinella zimbabwensis]